MDSSLAHAQALDLLDGLRGRRVVEAALGYGSFVTIDLVGPRGDGSASGYHLWVYQCYWRLETDDEVIASCEDSRNVLAELVPQLTGKTVTAVDVELPSLSTTFAFDDLRLKTFATYSDEEDQYMLFLPGGDVLAAGPGSRWTLEERSSDD